MWDIVLIAIGIGLLVLAVYSITHPHQQRGDFYDNKQKNRDDALTYLGKHPKR